MTSLRAYEVYRAGWTHWFVLQPSYDATCAPVYTDQDGPGEWAETRVDLHALLSSTPEHIVFTDGIDIDEAVAEFAHEYPGTVWP